MRVVLWLRTFLPELGGIQTLGALLADGWHDSATRCSSSPPRADRRPGPGAASKRRRGPPASDPSSHWPAPSRIGSLCTGPIEREIDSFSPDVVHVHMAGPYVAYANELYRRRSVPWLLTVHNNHAGQGRRVGRESPLAAAMATAGQVTAVPTTRVSG